MLCTKELSLCPSRDAAATHGAVCAGHRPQHRPGHHAVAATPDNLHVKDKSAVRNEKAVNRGGKPAAVQ